MHHIDTNLRYYTQQGHSPIAQRQQQLPPFSEIVPPALHSAIDTSSHIHNRSAHTSDNMTASYPSLSAISRPIAPSPAQSHSSSIPSISEGLNGTYDQMYYRRPGEQSQGWGTASAQHVDPSLSSIGSTRPVFSGNGSSGLGLPPLRNTNQPVEKNGIYDQNYTSSNSYYPSMYPQSPVSQNNDITTDRGDNRRSGSFYDSNSRYGQTYPQPRTYPVQPEFSRYSHQSNDLYYSANNMRTASYPETEHGHYALHGRTQSISGDTSDSRGKRRRGNLPKPVTDVLRAWFHDHLDHPYPSEEDKQIFIQKTGLSISQISNWFINARRRHLPALRQNRDRERNAQRSSIDHSQDQRL